jgi:hypothetical protein
MKFLIKKNKDKNKTLSSRLKKLSKSAVFGLTFVFAFLLGGVGITISTSTEKTSLAESTFAQIENSAEENVDTVDLNEGVQPLADVTTIPKLTFTVYENDTSSKFTDYTMENEGNRYSFTYTYLKARLKIKARNYNSTYMVANCRGDGFTSSTDSSNSSYRDLITATAAGDYDSILTFTLKDGYAWEDGSTDPIVIDVNIKQRTVVMPTLLESDEGNAFLKTVNYSVKDMQYLNLEGDAKDKDWIKISRGSIFTAVGTDWTNNLIKSSTIAGKSVGEYTLSISLVDTLQSNICWEDGTNETKVFTLKIEPFRMQAPDLAEEIDSGEGTTESPFRTEFFYDGNEKQLTFTAKEGFTFVPNGTTVTSEYQIIYMSTKSSQGTVYWTFKLSSDKTKLTATYYSTKLTEASHNIIFSGANNNCLWSTDYYRIYYSIKISSPKVEKPVLQGVDSGTGTEADPYLKRFEYNGQQHSIIIEGFDETFMVPHFSSDFWTTSVSGTTLTATRIKTVPHDFDYAKLYITLNSATWQDGTTDNIYFNTLIERKVVPTPVLEGGFNSGTGTSTDPYIKQFNYDGTKKSLVFTLPEGYTFSQEGGDVTNVLYNYDSEYYDFEVSSDKRTLTATRTSEAITSIAYTIRIFTNDGYCDFENGNRLIYFAVKIVKAKLEKPVLQDADGGTGTNADPYYKEFEYDGQNHSLIITGVNEAVMNISANEKYWAYTIEDGTMTLTRLESNVATAGTYSAYININASSQWQDGTTGAVYFKLVITRKAISDPVLDNEIVRGDGTEANPFVLQKEYDKASFTISFSNYDNTMLNCSISSSATSYILNYDETNKTFSITRKSANVTTSPFNIALKNANYCWADGSTTNRFYTLNIVKKQINIPTFSDHDEANDKTKTLVYDEQSHQFIFNGVPNEWVKYTINKSVNSGAMTLVSWENDVLTLQASNACNYTIVFTLVDSDNTAWADTSYTVEVPFSVIIEKKEIEIPTIVGNDGKDTIEIDFTGNPQQVQISGVDENYIQATLPTGVVNKGVSEGVLTLEVVASGTYSINLAVKDFNNFKWQGKDDNSVTYQIIVGTAKVEKPTLQGAEEGQTKITAQFNNSQILMVVEGVTEGLTYTLPEGMTLVSHENNVLTVGAFNYGTYVLTISLKDNNFTWADGSTGAVTFELKIERWNLTIPYLDDGSIAGTTVTKTYSGEWYELKIHAKSGGVLTWRNVRAEQFEFVSWEDDLLILRAKDRGTYRVYVEHANTSNTRWDFVTGSGVSTVTSAAVFTLTIDRNVINRPVLAEDSASGTVNYNHGEYYYLKINNAPKGIIQYEFTGSAMEIESWENDVLIFKANEVAAYTVSLSLIDSDNYGIEGISSISKVNFKLTIRKYYHGVPQYKDVRIKTYNAEKQEFVITNLFKEWDTYTAPAGVEEVSWTDAGVLTLRMKDVGVYDINVAVKDPNNSYWVNYGTVYYERTIKFEIKTKFTTAKLSLFSTDSDLQASFESGSYTWPAGAAVWGVITLPEVDPSDHPELNVYYFYSNESAKLYPLEEDSSMGVYYFKFPERFAPGTHYFQVNGIVGKNVNYKLGRYSLRFNINTAISDFADTDLVWQYKNNNKTIVVGNDVGTKEKPIELPYNAKAYSFSITKTASELQTLGVRISSYTGNTASTEARDEVYCAKVTIVAYNSKYYFVTKTYEVYYKIGKVKIDLSGISWNYSSPLTYTGGAQNVYINGSTLPAGLSVKGYSGDVNVVNATEGTDKKYVTTVEFEVSSNSYYLPQMSDPDSYDGTFSWSIEWEINKASINVAWKQGKLVTDEGAFEVPVLIYGNGYVRYSFEQQGDDGQFFAIDQLVKVPGKAVNYRVTATLKDGTGSAEEVNYAQNYKLVVNDSENNPNPIGFTIGKDQYPVQIGIEINGQIIDIGEDGVSVSSFPYTGNQYVAKPVVFGGDLSIENFTVTYYSSSSVKGTTVAPTDVGHYRVLVTITYKTSGSYDSDDYFIEGNNEFQFEISKADFDLTNLKWQYSHEGVVLGTYDNNQGKWIDEMGREVAPMTYDGKAYKLSLLGANDIIGLTIRLTGAEGTDVGNYVAHADFNYNSQNYNKPVFADFNWKIDKGNLDVSGVHWNYETAFTFDYAGGNATVYKVELVGLPEYLKDKIVYTTNGVTGNSASDIGEYLTSFVLSTIDTTRYNEVVWPENLLSEITWEILQKRLFTPVYQFEMGEDDTEEIVAWEFDAQVHELLSYFNNIDQSLSNYFNILVEYAPDGISFTQYGGYYGNKFGAIYAGTYGVTFAIKDGINTNANNVVWGNGKASNQYFRVLVSKAHVIVTGWNEAEEDSTVTIDKGPEFLNVFKYNYLDEAEKIIPIDYIYNSVGGETFYITPVLKTEFKNSVDFEFASGVSQKLSFTTIEPEENENPPLRFDKPQTEEIVIEFDNLEHTLQISDWISNWNELQQYMSIVENESDSLTQLAVGEYSVVLRFNKDAYVSWKTENESLIDKSTLTLKFKITTRVLELPVIAEKDYSGQAIDVSENFDEIFKNFTTCISGNVGTNVGEYELVLSLKYPENSTWSDGTVEEKRITWKINPAVLELPTLNGTLTFDGSEHNVLEILNGFNADIMKIASEGSHAIDAGSYVATIVLTNDNYVWADNSEKVSINWEISKFKVSKPSIDSSVSIIYDGEAHNVTNILKDYDPRYMIISGTDRATDANSYSISISLPGDNYIWADETSDDLQFSWEIRQRVLNISDLSNVTFDNLKHNILEALGLTLDDLNFMSLKVSYNDNELTNYEWFNVGNYKLVLTIDSAFNVSANNIIFSDNTTDEKTIVFAVEKLQVEVTGWNKDNENSTAIFNSSVMTKDMFDYVFTDKDGNIVSKDEIANAEQGSEFTIKLAVKAEFENNVEFVYASENLKSYTFIVGEDASVVWVPTINDVTYTGQEINIWETLSDRLGDRVDVVSGATATDAGEYTLVLALKDKSSTTWNDGTTDDKSITWNIVALQLEIPQNNGSFTVFDNNSHNLLEVCGTDELNKFITVNIKFNNQDFISQDFMAINHGVYTVTFAIGSEYNTNATNVCWSDGSTGEKTVEITVSKLAYNVTGWNENNENSTITSDDVVNEEYLNYVITDQEGNIVTKEEVANAEGQGKTFNVTVSVKDEYAENVELNFAEGISETFTFTTSQDALEKVEKPTIATEGIVFDKTEHNVNEVLVGFDENKMEFSEDSQLVATNAGTYTIVISLKSGYGWADESIEDLVLSWSISKVNIVGSWNRNGETPVFECEDTSLQEEVTVAYFDKENNPVTELTEGEEYIARVEVKDSDNYQITGQTEISFVYGEDITIFELIESNTTFRFVFENGDAVDYSSHIYDSANPIYLKNIAFKDTLQDIANQFKNTGIRFFSKNGDEISGDKKIATGMKLRLYDGEDIIDELTLVLKGDVNGDGEINMLDKATLNAYTSGSIVLENAFKLASDINDDGNINMLDKATLNAFTSGSIDLFDGLSVKDQEAVRVENIITSEELVGNVATINSNSTRERDVLWIALGLITVGIITSIAVFAKVKSKKSDKRN